MDLGAVLASHRPVDALEAQHLAEMVDLWAALGEASTRRTTYAPGHFTASALVLAPDHSAVALIHHAKLGIWVQPGGHIEPADTDADVAARREAAEEVGLGELVSMGLIDVDVHAIPANRDEPPHHHFDLRLGFVAGGGGLVAGDGATDARWVAFGEVDRYRLDSGLLRAIGKLRAPS